MERRTEREWSSKRTREETAREKERECDTRGSESEGATVRERE